MTTFSPISGLVGGALIGLAATILMLTIGRIADVSGILLNTIFPEHGRQKEFETQFAHVVKSVP